MVKYLGMVACLLSVVAIANVAQARGRHGCASCGVAQSCPGGVCAAPVAYAPAKSAATDNAPPAIVDGAPAAAPVAVTAQPAPRYYANTTARRGIFGWRR